VINFELFIVFVLKNGSCHTDKRVMSATWMSHVTREEDSCHTHDTHTHLSHPCHTHDTHTHTYLTHTMTHTHTCHTHTHMSHTWHTHTPRHLGVYTSFKIYAYFKHIDVHQKETNKHDKRDLHTWQKRPTHMTRETNTYDQRDLHKWPTNHTHTHMSHTWHTHTPRHLDVYTSLKIYAFHV